MNKTPLQELIEYYNSTDNPIDIVNWIGDNESRLLAKERKQMIDFYTWMRINDGAEKYFHYSDEDMLTEYLNK